MNLLKLILRSKRRKRKISKKLLFFVELISEVDLIKSG